MGMFSDDNSFHPSALMKHYYPYFTHMEAESLPGSSRACFKPNIYGTGCVPIQQYLAICGHVNNPTGQTICIHSGDWGGAGEGQGNEVPVILGNYGMQNSSGKEQSLGVKHTQI